MNFALIVNKEIAALQSAITSQHAEIAWLEAAVSGATGWGGSRKARARVTWAQRQLSLLQETLDYIRQPVYAPTSFATADKPCNLIVLERSGGPNTYRGRKEREDLLRDADDPYIADYTEQCTNLKLCWDVVQGVVYQATREKLRHEFLAEARLWTVERIKKEIEHRESERNCMTHRLDRRRVKVLTTADCLIETDPADIAAPFLHTLIVELTTLLHEKEQQQKQPAIDPFIADICRKAMQQMAGQGSTTNLRDQLIAKCVEMKKALPHEYHRSLDEFFRKEIDKIMKAGKP